ncbi:MAG: hypothetical protein KGJ59_01290 [Bacteroidota bacterium]|nr:hypothetical protein [Bacteroidota bacterium]
MKKILLSSSAFVAALVLHASYFVIQAKTLAERWAMTNETNYIQFYVERSEYLIGASYALAIGFSVFALLRFLETRKKGFAGLVGGITLTGVLYVAGCFLLGCCGSPMLAVYLTLFGSSFLGFTKLLTFALTLSSIVVGYIWMERKSLPETDCCEGEEECKPT